MDFRGYNRSEGSGRKPEAVTFRRQDQSCIHILRTAGYRQKTIARIFAGLLLCSDPRDGAPT